MQLVQFDIIYKKSHDLRITHRMAVAILSWYTKFLNNIYLVPKIRVEYYLNYIVQRDYSWYTVRFSISHKIGSDSQTEWQVRDDDEKRDRIPILD